MRDLAAHAEECFPDTAFFLCTDEEMPHITGAELFRLCRKAPAVLDGFGQRSHIALLGPSCAAWLAAYFAVLSAGRVIVPLHDGMQQQELEDCVRQADCSVLLYDRRRAETASVIADEVPGLCLLELHTFIQMLREEERESLPELEAEAVAAMYFTSGTMGKARCVMLTHRNMGSQISSVTEVLPLSEKDVGLSLLPLSHTFEMMTYIAGALHCGGTLYLNESVRTVKKNLREKKPTILVAVPLILQTLHKEILNTARKQGRLDRLQRAVRLSGYSLHLFEILSACSSFYAYLISQELQEGTEQEYTAIRPVRNGLLSDSTHEILGRRDQTHILLEHRTPPALNGQNLPECLDAAAAVSYNGEDAFTEELHAADFETAFAQLNRLFSKCHHLEKAFFGLKGRTKFSNAPSMVGLFLLAFSHSGVHGGITRAWKIEKILHYLQTGYGKNPCKGFGG
jgi:hypothetical protein